MSGRSDGLGAELEDDLDLLDLNEPGTEATPLRRRERRRGRRIVLGLAVVVALMLGTAAGSVYYLSENIGNNIARVPGVFGPLDAATRPPDEPTLTFVLLGTDTRSTDPTTGTDAVEGVDAGSERSDVVMLAQLDPARTGASVVSIPRDSWVDIPGHGRGKINAAYAYGGPTLLIQTIEQLTGVHVDHFAVIDFAGFQSMVDAVDGIDVRIAQATRNAGVSFKKGENHLDGAAALAYVRQRYRLPGGDLDRARRQQNALRALLTKAATGGILADPIKFYRFLDATSRSVGVDDTLTNGGLRQLAFESRGLRPAGVTFLSAPVRGTGREGPQSVVYLDDVRAAGLWEALRTGTTSDYATRNPDSVLGDTPA